MNHLVDFAPDAARAVALDRHMRARLAASLRHIVAQADGRIAMDHAALEGFFARVAAGPVSARVFGAYCDLVLAIDDDRLALAEALLGEIGAAPHRPTDLLILDLGDARNDPVAERYVRLIDSDPAAPFAVLPPPPAAAAACRERIDAAFRLLDAGDPALAAEIRVLIGEIVIAVGPDDPTAPTFDGASAFMLWGAVMLNARGHRNALEMAQALAHESGHNLLFGLCADGPLVENDDEPRYASPLRADPRPMDGIVHATYVTARMHLAVARLLAAGVLDDAATAEAHASLAAHRRAFAQGIEVIDRHGSLTGRGEAIMAGARAYMTGSA
jgi:HEXXH motif-containing protein